MKHKKPLLNKGFLVKAEFNRYGVGGAKPLYMENKKQELVELLKIHYGFKVFRPGQADEMKKKWDSSRKKKK